MHPQAWESRPAGRGPRALRAERRAAEAAAGASGAVHGIHRHAGPCDSRRELGSRSGGQRLQTPDAQQVGWRLCGRFAQGR